MNEESRNFLKAYFGDDLTGVYVCDSTNWQPVPAATAVLDPRADWYWCPSRLSGLDAKGQRVAALAVSVHALVVDDVGKKVNLDEFEVFAGVPDTMVETSAGNFQAGFRLSGLTPAEFADLRARVPWDVDGPSCVHWFRLPGGVHQKTGFRIRDAVYGTGSLGWLLPHPRAGAPRQGSGGEVEKAPSIEAVRKLLAGPLKNEWDGNDNSGLRQHWFNVIAAVKGSLPDHPAEAEEMARDYSGPNEQDFDRVWASIDPPRSGWGALEIMAKEKAGASEAFDDGAVHPEPEPMELSGIVLVGKKAMPRRPWVYGKRLVRGYVSTTVAAGGVGKSSLTLVEAISMATGKDLLGVGQDKMPKKPLRVWVWNGEDPQSEIVLRVEAACAHYGVNNADLAGRLFADSGRDKPMKLAVANGKGLVVNEGLVASVIAGVKARRVDVLVIDPLVSTHYANENDNGQMDLVLKTIGRIAGECGCAVEVVHHTRKGQGEEVSVDDARGAGAVIAAARYLRVLTPMSKQVGDKHGIVGYRGYFCVSKDAVKTNMTPPLDSDRWYRMVGVDMENGDPFGVDGPEDSESVGVCEKWVLTIANIDRTDMVAKCHALMAGKTWRHNDQTGPDWVGNPVAEALGLDLGQGKVVRTTVKEAIEKWIRDGWLRKVQGHRGNRQSVSCVEIGNAPPEF